MKLLHKLWSIAWLLSTHSFHDLRSLQKRDPVDVLSLTIGGERSSLIYAFKPESLQEKNIHAEISRKAASSVFYNDTLIVCGGQSESGENRGLTLNSCDRYTTGLDTHEGRVPNLPLSLQYFSLIVYRQDLLVIGGAYQNETTNEKIRSNIVYKLNENSWIALPSKTLSSKSSHSCVVIYPENSLFVDINQERTQDIYCFGGMHDKGRSNAMEVFHHDAAEWKVAPNMTMPRSSFSATSYKMKIYVTGGTTDAGVENTLEIFDINLQEWRLSKALMDRKRYYHTSFYVSGFLYIRGGINKDDPQSARESVEVMVIDKNSGDPKGEFFSHHTRYEGKSLHCSTIVPRNFIPQLESADIYQTTPEYEDDHDNSTSHEGLLLSNNNVQNILFDVFKNRNTVSEPTADPYDIDYDIPTMEIPTVPYPDYDLGSGDYDGLNETLIEENVESCGKKNGFLFFIIMLVIWL